MRRRAPCVGVLLCALLGSLLFAREADAQGSRGRRAQEECPAGMQWLINQCVRDVDPTAQPTIMAKCVQRAIEKRGGLRQPLSWDRAMQDQLGDLQVLCCEMVLHIMVCLRLRVQVGGGRGKRHVCAGGSKADMRF